MRLLLWLLIVYVPGLYAQNEMDPQALKIMEKAMAPLENEKGSAIYFEGLAYGVKEPSAIFTLPAYQVFRGGFLFQEGKKFEMQLGMMKGLSDGKTMVMVDEISKVMYVDSVRRESPIKGERPDIAELLKKHIGESSLKYSGKEKVKGIECHKIEALSKAEERTIPIIYWVDVKNNQLVLMADKQNDLYNVYWIKSMGLPPKGHDYSVKLPAKELEKFHGYEVIDQRYITRELK